MKPEEIGGLVDMHGKSVYSFCIYLTQNKADAEDLYQEIFLKALERPDKIDKEKNVKSYLLSVAVFLWKSRKRKQARRQSIAPMVDLDDVLFLPSADDPERQFLSSETTAQVRNAVGALEEKFKLLLYLHYTAGASVEEIARILRIPGGTVKSRLYKARKLVKKELEAASYEELQIL